MRPETPKHSNDGRGGQDMTVDISPEVPNQSRNTVAENVGQKGLEFRN